MDALAKFTRAITRRIPGTAAARATDKRALEKKLRSDGWSRNAAKAEVARRFKNER